jgi:uncharacterized membrane protein
MNAPERPYHPRMNEGQAEELKRSLEELRARVEGLERLVRPKSGAPSTPAAPAAPESLAPGGPAAPSPPAVPAHFRENLRKPPPRDQGLGAGWLLGAVAVVCFVLAASFLVKLAIDSGWLTPARQVAMAATVGGALIAAGVMFADRDRAFLSLLPGTGIVILYMCAYGGHLYYGLYSGWTAVALVSLVSVVALVLYRGFDQQYYALVAIAGTYVCPLLVPALRGQRMDLMVLYLLWDATFAALSVLLGGRFLLLMAAYLSIASFAAATVGAWMHPGGGSLAEIAIFQAVQFGVFLAAIVVYSTARRSALGPWEAWAYFPLLLFFYMVEYALVARIRPDAAPWLAIAFAACVYFAYAFAAGYLGEARLESRELVIVFLAIVFVHAVYFELVPSRATPWFALALAIGWPVLLSWIQPKGGTPFLWLLLSVIVAVNYAKVLIGWGEGVPGGEWIVLNFAFAAAALWKYLRTGARGSFPIGAYTVLLLGNVQAMTGLYRLSTELTGTDGSPTASRFVVSVAWAMLAVGILLWGRATRDRVLARSSLFIFAVATGKVLLFDVASAGPVVRILCLASLGVALFVGGYLFRQIDRWGEARA